MADDATTTTGLAVPTDASVGNEGTAGADAAAVSDVVQVPDRLSPPVISANDAVYSDSQILSAETQTARRIVFRVPRVAVLDLEGSYLAYKVNVDVRAQGNEVESSLSFPALVGGGSVIESCIVRIGAQEVQRIDDFGWWLAKNAPQLSTSQQQFVRSYMDLSGTRYGAKPGYVQRLARNKMAMEDLNAAPHGQPTGPAGAPGVEMRKLEYVFQVQGRRVMSHVTIPLMALCPELFAAMRLYPSIAAEQLSFELVIRGDQTDSFAVGGTRGVAATSVTKYGDTNLSPVIERLTPAGAPPRALTGTSISDPIIMAEFLTMPAPILNQIVAQVESGLSRYAFSRLVKKVINLAQGATLQDQPIRVDNSILSGVSFMRKMQAGNSLFTNSRLGAYQSVAPFTQFNINVNNVDYFEKPLNRGVDFEKQADRKFDGYHLPACLRDPKTVRIMQQAAQDGQDGAYGGVFEHLDVDFMLEQTVGRQPLLVRASGDADLFPDGTVATRKPSFEQQVTVYLEQANSLILAASRSRVL